MARVARLLDGNIGGGGRAGVEETGGINKGGPEYGHVEYTEKSVGKSTREVTAEGLTESTGEIIG